MWQALVNLCLGYGVPRLGDGFGKCLARERVPRWGLALGIVSLRYGVPRWGAGIGEGKSKGRSAKIEGWHW